MSDAAGRSNAATIVAPLRRGWGTWLRVLFWMARHVPAIPAPMQRLSFIHFIQWSVVDRLPGPDGGERLPATCMYFESNFDGDLTQYVDTFVHAVPGHMRLVWSGVEGFPGLFPIEDYIAWSASMVQPSAHYYCAYPSATTTTVAHAVTLAGELDAFVAETAPLDAASFGPAWRRFVGSAVRWL